MLFNSFEFALFFPVVTALYFLLPHRFRWALLLAASCLFYMAFIPAYILILILTIVVDYFAAIWIEDRPNHKRGPLLFASIVSTCAILFVFKYYHFAAANVAAMSNLLGWNYGLPALQIILPIGLSFHTFQSLSYVIEVYRGHQKAERHFGIYSLYVMFYPQLVAGPIERPQNLLHQFHAKHTFNYDDITSGLRLMVWGLFKKVVIADRLSIYVNGAYRDPENVSGPTLAVATIFFAYQIYCDFSGYSDIAIGSARTMGFRLMKNFDRPYSALTISEFWRRWHISLSTWFRDYVYFPLGGSKGSHSRTSLNLFITFLISGLWHGANWTYVVWGALNGLYLVIGRALAPARNRLWASVGLPESNPVRRCIQLATTLVLTLIAWVFFRANSIPEALTILSRIASGRGRLSGSLAGFRPDDWLVALAAIGLLEFVQWYQSRNRLSQDFQRLPSMVRSATYVSAVACIVLFGAFTRNEFIYFQF